MSLLSSLLALLGSTDLDPALPYRAEKVSPVVTDVDFTAVVTAPEGTKLLRVWLPIPPSDGAQEVLSSTIETFPSKVDPRIGEEPLFGNRFAYFEFPEPKGGQSIRHRFRVRVHELRFHLDPGRVERVETWPDSFAPYLRSETQAVVVNAAVREAAATAVPKPAGAALDYARVVDWVDANLRYDHHRASLRASSEWALENRAGHCSDYHGLCSALGRALGYPTRVTYGMNLFPKNSPSHCKAEIFLPPVGWVSFDVSETQKLCAKIASDASLDEARKKALLAAAKRRLHEGFRDNTWCLLTRGTDYDLAPPASRRVPVVRTLYAEADGVAIPDPDPGDAKMREFGWMTVHSFTPDRAVPYPFKDWRTLETAPGGAR
ncbi:MAG: transglutaminase domain-containing protein [Planctomycetes bacterium]|nr:transglutaminase domain-containing protein [Planctomycetota bacterium]